MFLEKFKNKRVGVVGMGEEGMVVAEFLLKHGIKPVLFDQKQPRNLTKYLNYKIEKNQVETYFKKDITKYLNQCDIVFRSPGVPYEYLRKLAKNIEITSQTDLFLRMAPCQIVGVTGTKGKGTTSTLLFRVLNYAIRHNLLTQNSSLTKKSQIFLVGNIGESPPLSILDKLKKSDLVVFELSSFQLEDLTISPHIAVVLKITPDHLDVHKSMEKYVNAKKPIVKFQGSQDYVIYNPNFKFSNRVAESSIANKIQISDKPKLVLDNPTSFTSLENFAAAEAVAELLGVRQEAMKEIFKGFQGLANRVEFVVKKKGVSFYNDSAATIPEATVHALRNVKEPTILLLGGVSKVKDYTVLAKELSKNKNLKKIILFGKNAIDLKKILLSNKVPEKIIERGGKTFAAVFEKVKLNAEKGDIVLLSPASSSFDMFENYKERGKEFIKYAKSF